MRRLMRPAVLALNFTTVTGHASEDTIEAHAKLDRLWRNDRLPKYLDSMIRPKPDDGRTNCHNNTASLAYDLIRSGEDMGWSFLLGWSSDIGPHSWLEYGDAAADVSFDGVVLLSTADFHREIRDIVSSRRFRGKSGFWDYVRLTPSDLTDPVSGFPPFDV